MSPKEHLKAMSAVMKQLNDIYHELDKIGEAECANATNTAYYKVCKRVDIIKPEAEKTWQEQ